MADLASILAETSKSYDASRNALQGQIDAIGGNLEAQKQRIDNQYAQQAKTLDNQRNYQAQASSMAASSNGGSFGGSAEIANKKYYQQAFVPAVTQMQTNHANDLSSAESQANNSRLNLQTQLASLNDEMNRYALQRYDTAVQAEKDEAFRQAQLEEQKRQFDAQQAAQARQAAQQAAQQNAYQSYLSQALQSSQPQSPASTASSKYGYGNYGANGITFYNNATGNNVTFGTYAKNAGANSTAKIMQLAQATVGNANANDYQKLQNIVNSGYNLKTVKANDYKYNNKLTADQNSLLKSLGLTI